MTTESGAMRAGAPSDNTTLVAVLADLEAEGYVASFSARDGGQVQCVSCRAESAAAEFEVGAVRRLEGASDPDAQVLLVAATCPACGARGTAVFGYGPEASKVDADAVAALDLDGVSPSGYQPSSTPR